MFWERRLSQATVLVRPAGRSKRFSSSFRSRNHCDTVEEPSKRVGRASGWLGCPGLLAPVRRTLAYSRLSLITDLPATLSCPTIQTIMNRAIYFAAALLLACVSVEASL